MADRSRRARGMLEADIKRVCDAYITGQYKVPDDKPLTPYRAAQALKDIDGLDPDTVPSSGAVDAVFDRWAEIGFAEFTHKPFAFADYTEDARTVGLAELHRRDAATRAAARKAALGAETQAAQEGTPTAAAPAENAGQEAQMPYAVVDADMVGAEAVVEAGAQEDTPSAQDSAQDTPSAQGTPSAPTNV